MMVLLPLTLGFLQFAVNYNTTLGVQYVCREAARFASVNGRKANSEALIKARAVATAQSIGLNLQEANVAVTIPTTVAMYDTVPITVTYDMSKRRFFPGRVFKFEIFSSTYSVTEQVVLEGA